MPMLEIFIVSILAGVVLGAPVGVAGAMVADAALAHNKLRLYSTIVAAVAGDTLLAYVSSLSSHWLRGLLKDHATAFKFGSGAAIIVLGLSLALVTALSHQGVLKKEHITDSSKWLLGHTAPAFAVFILAILHPGSILAFLATVAILSSKIPHFSEARELFTGGICIGSAGVFAFSGFLFWTIRKKADRFVYYLRYGLATIVLVLGIYLLADKAILQNIIQE